ncbi:hypothetical protein DNI29_17695 [Hymenobacter sediminis]|uniref:hypothetical protein n=1 Tax=Hymenobacter sediminis TaxID=2218621 RepID=UPI000DA64C09|nr:hypothetical protein [Hymenobacter sediminis]RPD45226.1 hypothetical protein DNI29_17695 [Hymenobacter sediminis]
MPQLAGLPLYFENPIGRLYEHPDGYAIIAYNPGPRQLATFQAFLQHLENMLRRHGWNKILADHRQLTPFTEEEHVFLHEHWLQTSHASGQQMLTAVLISAEQLAELPAEQQQTAHVGTLTYHLFADVASATAWLRPLV